MKKYTQVTYIVVLAATLGTFTTAAIAARTLSDLLNDSTPRSIFDDVRDSAPVRASVKDLAGE